MKSAQKIKPVVVQELEKQRPVNPSLFIPVSTFAAVLSRKTSSVLSVKVGFLDSLASKDHRKIIESYYRERKFDDLNTKSLIRAIEVKSEVNKKLSSSFTASDRAYARNVRGISEDLLMVLGLYKSFSEQDIEVLGLLHHIEELAKVEKFFFKLKSKRKASKLFGYYQVNPDLKRLFEEKISHCSEADVKAFVYMIDLVRFQCFIADRLSRQEKEPLEWVFFRTVKTGHYLDGLFSYLMELSGAETYSIYLDQVEACITEDNVHAPSLSAFGGHRKAIKLPRLTVLEAYLKAADMDTELMMQTFLACAACDRIYSSAVNDFPELLSAMNIKDISERILTAPSRLAKLKKFAHTGANR